METELDLVCKLIQEQANEVHKVESKEWIKKLFEVNPVLLVQLLFHIMDNDFDLGLVSFENLIQVVESSQEKEFYICLSMLLENLSSRSQSISLMDAELQKGWIFSVCRIYLLLIRRLQPNDLESIKICGVRVRDVLMVDILKALQTKDSSCCIISIQALTELSTKLQCDFGDYTSGVTLPLVAILNTNICTDQSLRLTAIAACSTLLSSLRRRGQLLAGAVLPALLVMLARDPSAAYEPYILLPTCRALGAAARSLGADATPHVSAILRAFSVAVALVQTLSLAASASTTAAAADAVTQEVDPILDKRRVETDAEAAVTVPAMAASVVATESEAMAATAASAAAAAEVAADAQEALLNAYVDLAHCLRQAEAVRAGTLAAALWPVAADCMVLLDLAADRLKQPAEPAHPALPARTLREAAELVDVLGEAADPACAWSLRTPATLTLIAAAATTAAPPAVVLFGQGHAAAAMAEADDAAAAGRRAYARLRRLGVAGRWECCADAGWSAYTDADAARLELALARRQAAAAAGAAAAMEADLMVEVRGGTHVVDMARGVQENRASRFHRQVRRVLGAEPAAVLPHSNNAFPPSLAPPPAMAEDPARDEAMAQALYQRAYWCEARGGGSGAGAKVVVVDAGPSESAWAAAVFHRSMPARGGGGGGGGAGASGGFNHTFGLARGREFEVVRIERVENGPQLDGLLAKRRGVREELDDEAAAPGGEGFCEQRHAAWGFHGTQDQSVDAIVRDRAGGFKPMLSGSRVGAVYGDGTYFARNAIVSDNFAAATVAGSAGIIGETRRMILARLVVGRCAQGVAGLRDVPAGYHSLADRPMSPTVWVIQDRAAAYPAYILTYRRVS